MGDCSPALAPGAYLPRVRVPGRVSHCARESPHELEIASSPGLDTAGDPRLLDQRLLAMTFILATINRSRKCFHVFNALRASFFCILLRVNKVS